MLLLVNDLKKPLTNPTRKTRDKIKLLLILIVFVLVLLFVFIGTTIYCLLKMHQIENELQQLRSIDYMGDFDFNDVDVEQVDQNEAYFDYVNYDDREEGEIEFHPAFKLTKDLKTRMKRNLEMQENATESANRSKSVFNEEIITESSINRQQRASTKNPSSNDQHTTREIKPNRSRPRHRQKYVETMDEQQMTSSKSCRKPTFAAQFSGDTSKYVLGQHTNFKGNGHLKHADKTYIDWIPNDWFSQFNMNQHFQLKNGKMIVNEAGLYFIYAQIYYLDEHDMNGYRVYKNNEAFLQCTTMTHSTNRIVKGNTCFTGGVEYLAKGDAITVRDLSDERYSLFEKGKSYFGAFLIGDMRIK